MDDIGRVMLLFGAVLLVVGLLVAFEGRIPVVGRLPGDMAIEREDVRVYVPLGTAIVVTFVLSLLMILLRR